jgi:hypothetical protein
MNTSTQYITSRVFNSALNKTAATAAASVHPAWQQADTSCMQYALHAQHTLHSLHSTAALLHPATS